MLSNYLSMQVWLVSSAGHETPWLDQIIDVS